MLLRLGIPGYHTRDPSIVVLQHDLAGWAAIGGPTNLKSSTGGIGLDIRVKLNPARIDWQRPSIGFHLGPVASVWRPSPNLTRLHLLARILGRLRGRLEPVERAITG